MMREKLRPPATFATDDTPGAPGDKEETEAAFEARMPELIELHDRLMAEKDRRLLLVLQGLDGSGKGGAVKKVVGRLNVNAVEVTSFKKPTDEELSHHFLWRIERALPEAGELGVFDRSHYEDVLVVRVHDIAPVEGRYDEINEFEAKLAGDGVTLVKCYLQISPEEQAERMIARLEDPTKRWKFNERDLDERDLWTQYDEAYAAMLDRCDTDVAPWYVIPADRKWYRNWALQSLLLETLREMDPRYPPREELDDEALRARLAADPSASARP
jgi:PPK2 family polyphosphate:nucleotide phosphotransferase